MKHWNQTNSWERLQNWYFQSFFFLINFQFTKPFVCYFSEPWHKVMFYTLSFIAFIKIMVFGTNWISQIKVWIWPFHDHQSVEINNISFLSLFDFGIVFKFKPLHHDHSRIFWLQVILIFAWLYQNIFNTKALSGEGQWNLQIHK